MLYDLNEFDIFLKSINLKSNITTIVCDKKVVLKMHKKKLKTLIINDYIDYGYTSKKISLDNLKVILTNAIIN